jgi:hypothetical protein
MIGELQDVITSQKCPMNNVLECFCKKLQRINVQGHDVPTSLKYEMLD